VLAWGIVAHRRELRCSHLVEHADKRILVQHELGAFGIDRHDLAEGSDASACRHAGAPPSSLNAPALLGDPLEHP
jgi:hypothetical protein